MFGYISIFSHHRDFHFISPDVVTSSAQFEITPSEDLILILSVDPFQKELVEFC